MQNQRGSTTGCATPTGAPAPPRRGRLERVERESVYGQATKDGSPRVEKDWRTPVLDYAGQSGAAGLEGHDAVLIDCPPHLGSLPSTH